jgi:hypothetical protein
MTDTTTEIPRVNGLPVEELLEQSRTTKPRPGRVLAAGFAWIFVALGAVIGGTWRGLSFCAVSARYGYWRGRGLTDEEIVAKVGAKRAAKLAAQAPQPGPAPGRT